MDPIITKETLEAIGVKINPEQEQALVDNANSMLKERIGLAIAEGFSDEQLAKMRELVAAGDNAALSAWIDEQVPDLDQLIEDEVDILLGDLVKQDAV